MTVPAGEAQADPDKMCLRRAPAAGAEDAFWGGRHVPKGYRCP